MKMTLGQLRALIIETYDGDSVDDFEGREVSPEELADRDPDAYDALLDKLGDLSDVSIVNSSYEGLSARTREGDEFSWDPSRHTWVKRWMT